MAKSSKKAAAAAAPVVAVQDKKSAKKGKRAPEEAVEKVVNAKKQKLQKDEALAAKKKLEAKTAKKKKVEPTSDDSDVESDEEPAKGKPKAKAPSKKTVKKAPAKKAEPSDSSDGSDSDESEEEENVVTASAPKKVVSDEGSSDSESEEEVSEDEKKPAAKSAPKAGAQKKVDESESESDGSEGSDSDDDNSDEESEEEEPVKVSKKKGTDVDMVDAATPKKANGRSENAPKTPATAEGGSKTLFVGNLSFNVEQSDVEAFFKDVGEIVEVRFASAPDGTFKGFGHVEFATSEEAQKALEMNGMDLSGRPVKLDLARERGAATPRSSNFPTGDSHSVFIRGFDKNLGEEEARSALQEHFGACGEMTRCSIPVDRESGCIKGKIEAKTLRNGEEDRDDTQEAFHLLNKCDHLEDIKYKSGNEDKVGTVDASLSDDCDESGDASEDSDDGLQLADDVGCPTVVSSGANSSFTRHVTHLLSEQEIEDLSSRKWRYQWEVPAFDSSNWKWKGRGDCLFKDAEPIMSYGLKQKLYKQWLDIYKASGGNDFHSSKQRIFFSLCSSYRDILHHNKKAFYLKGLHEDSSMMDAYIMHSLNHVFKCRDVVMKNEARLAKDHETGKDEVLSNNIYLDRGFCRPKVLILLPLASIALRIVKRLIQLTPSGNKVNVQHMDRFTNEFGVANIENVDDDLPLANGAEFENMMPQKPTKPSDFEALFGGNNNDHFMVGIKFTRKSIKLYGDFYTSDLIVASPLGLITKIEEAEIEKDKDVDYLSSIEILVIDHADVITMQNWSHVTTVLQHLNQLPSKNHGDDIMRVRQWYLDGQARFYRQSIILSSYITPEINALFNQQCANYEGKLKLSCEHKGILPKVVLQVRQIYERFPVDSLVDADDARFEYFIKKVFPKIKDTTQGGIMIFISSYFEFVRVRNFLKSQDSSFCLLGEYTKQSDISRARVWFFQGTRQIMLYTERAHFYHRYKIRGIKNLIIYSLPERKEFYPELVNMLQESHDMSCTVLFSRFDQFRLERIVGNTAAKRLVTSEKDLFLFC